MSWLETWTRKLNRSVEPVDDLAGAAESIALTLVSRLASWAASIPNALMVKRSAVSVFDVDDGIAWTIAVSLELIGQSLTAHWRKSKNWNMTKRKSDPEANEVLALCLMVTYFVIDLALVFFLAYAKYTITNDGQIFLAMAYPIIGIVTAIITNERASLFRMAKARQIEKEDRREARRNTKNSSGTVPEQSTVFDRRQRARSILTERPEIKGSELAGMLGCSAGMARRYKREIKNNGNGHKMPEEVRE